MLVGISESENRSLSRLLLLGLIFVNMVCLDHNKSLKLHLGTNGSPSVFFLSTRKKALRAKSLLRFVDS